MDAASCWTAPNRSWATNAQHDPDSTERNPSAQLGACEAVGDAASCCTLCSHTLGCLAWTFVTASASWAVPYVPRGTAGSCCLKFHRPRHRSYVAHGCTAGILQSRPCREHCQMPLLRSEQRARLPRPQTANASHFPWLMAQQLHQLRRAAPAQTTARPPRVAVCITGTTRSFIHPSVWRSIEQFVLGRSRNGNGVGTVGLDVFAVLSVGPEDAPHAAAQRARLYTPAEDLFPIWQWAEAFSWRSSSRPQQVCPAR